MRECPKNKGLQAFARVKKSSEKAPDNEDIGEINLVKSKAFGGCVVYKATKGQPIFN